MMRRFAVIALLSAVVLAKAAPSASEAELEADDLDSWKTEFANGAGDEVASPKAVFAEANKAASAANSVKSGVASADEPKVVQPKEESEESVADLESQPVIVESLESAKPAKAAKPAVQPKQPVKARAEIVRSVAAKAAPSPVKPTCDKFDPFTPNQACCRDEVSVKEYLTVGLTASELETSRDALVDAEERLRALLKKARSALKHKCDLDASCTPLDRSKDEELHALLAETKKVSNTHPVPDLTEAEAAKAKAARARAEAQAVTAKSQAEAQSVKEEGLFELHNATARANAVRTEAHAMLRDAIERVRVAEKQAESRREVQDAVHERAAVRHQQKMMALAEEEVQRKRMEAIHAAYKRVDAHVQEMEDAERTKVASVASKSMAGAVKENLQSLQKQREEGVKAIEDAVAEGRSMTRAEEKRVADALRRVTLRVTDEEKEAAEAAEGAHGDAAAVKAERAEVEKEVKEGEAQMVRVVKKMKAEEKAAAAAQEEAAEKSEEEMKGLVAEAREDAHREVTVLHAEHIEAKRDLLKEEDDIKRRSALQSERLDSEVRELQANYTAEVEAERLEGEATRTQLRREALEDREKSEQYAQLMEKKFEYDVKEQQKEDREEFNRELEAEREREHETIEEMRDGFKEDMEAGQEKAKEAMDEQAAETEDRLKNMERAVHELRDGMQSALSTVRAREAQLVKRETADRLHEEELEAELEEARGEGDAVEEMQQRAAAAEEEARRAEDTAAQKRAALDESIRQLGLVGATGGPAKAAPAAATAEEEAAAVEGDAEASVNTELQEAEANEQAAVDRAQAVTDKVEGLTAQLEKQREGVQAQLERDTKAMDVAVDAVRKQSAQTNKALEGHEEATQASAEEIAARTQSVVDNAETAHDRMDDVVDAVKRTSAALDDELQRSSAAATGAPSALEAVEGEEDDADIDTVVPPVRPATGSAAGGDGTSGSGFAFSPIEKEAADKRAREEIVRMSAEASAFKSVASNVVEAEPSRAEVNAKRAEMQAKVEQIAGDVLNKLRLN